MSTFQRLSNSLGISNTQSGIDSIIEVYENSKI